MPATQFNMKVQQPPVKFDFLGRNPDRDPERDGPPRPAISFDINLIPLDDKPSYDLYASAKTAAVFRWKAPA
jgi:DNA polymerase-3 subunit alpha